MILRVLRAPLSAALFLFASLSAVPAAHAETGVFMLLYLDLAYAQAKREGRMASLADLQHAIMQGAVMRLRPKFMTVMTMFLGLVPILWATGTGADVMKRIAAPMIGGMVSSTILTLIVIPVLYMLWRGRSLLAQSQSQPTSVNMVSEEQKESGIHGQE